MRRADAARIPDREHVAWQSQEDIRVTIQRITAQLCDEAGTPLKTLTSSALSVVAALPWRDTSELRDALSLLVNETRAETIQLEDVLARVRFENAPPRQMPVGTLRAARKQFEREYVALVLRHHQGRVDEAARALGIQRTNLYRKARQLGISVRARFERRCSTDARTER